MSTTKKKTKLLSLILVLCMVLSILPAMSLTALAANQASFDYASLVDVDGTEISLLDESPTAILETGKQYTLKLRFSKGDSTMQTHLSVSLPYGMKFVSGMGMSSELFDETLNIPRLSAGDLESMDYTNLPAINGYTAQTGTVVYTAPVAANPATPVAIAMTFIVAVDGHYVNSSQTQSINAITLKTWDGDNMDAAAQATLSATLTDDAPATVNRAVSDTAYLGKATTLEIGSIDGGVGKNVASFSFDVTYPAGATVELLYPGAAFTIGEPTDNEDGTLTRTYTAINCLPTWQRTAVKATFPEEQFAAGTTQSVVISNIKRTTAADDSSYEYAPSGSYKASFYLLAADATPGLTGTGHGLVKYDWPSDGVTNTAELLGTWSVMNGEYKDKQWVGADIEEVYVLEADFNTNGTEGRVKSIRIPVWAGTEQLTGTSGGQLEWTTDNGESGTLTIPTLGSTTRTLVLKNTNLGQTEDVGITHIKYTYGMLPVGFDTYGDGQQVYSSAHNLSIWGDITGERSMESTVRFYPENTDSTEISLEMPLVTTPTKDLSFYSFWNDRTSGWTGSINGKTSDTVYTDTDANAVTLTGQHRLGYYGVPLGNWPASTAYTMVDPVFYIVVPYGLSFESLDLKYGIPQYVSGDSTLNSPEILNYTMSDVSYLNTAGDGAKIYKVTVPKDTVAGYYEQGNTQRCIDYTLKLKVEKYADTKDYPAREIFFCTSAHGGRVVEGGGSMAAVSDTYNLNGGTAFYPLFGTGQIHVQSSVANVAINNALRVDGDNYSMDWMTYNTASDTTKKATTAFSDEKSEITYRTTMKNNTGTDITNYTVFIPIPKAGMDLGAEFSDGLQEMSMAIAEVDDTWATDNDFSVQYVKIKENKTFASETVPTDEDYVASTKTDCDMVILTYTGNSGIFASGGSVTLQMQMKIMEKPKTADALNVFKQAVTYNKGSAEGTKIVQPGVPVAIEYAGAAIEGIVFKDADRNGVKSDGEVGMPYVTVILEDAYTRIVTATGHVAGEYGAKMATGEAVTVQVQNPNANIYRFSPVSGGTTINDNVFLADTASHETATYELSIAGASEETPARASAGLMNTPIPGTLTVGKTLTGNAVNVNDAFTFEVTLQNAAGQNLTGTFPTIGTGGAANGSITLSNGKATLSLKGGQTIAIQNLPEGTKYAVTENEANQNGYSTTSESPSGVMTAKGAAALFTNSKYQTPVTPPGGDSSDNEYSVTLIKVNAEERTSYLSNATFQLYKSDGKLIGTYTTNSDGKITVSGLTNGSYYFVETVAPSGYKLDSSRRSFTISGKNTMLTVTNTKDSSANADGTPADLNSTDHIKYVIGYSDGTVRPNANISRAEVVSMFYRLLTAERRDRIFTSSNSFSDVTSNLWYNKAASSMAGGGYIQGYPDGTFGGENAITRAEFVAIAARFMNSNTGTVNFSDVTTSHWAYQYISTAVFYGWINGYSDGTFKPNQPITRAEAMAIINRMLNRGVKDEGVMTGFKVWPDNDSIAWYYYEVIEATNDHEYTGARPAENWTSLTTDYSYDIAKYERP